MHHVDRRPELTAQAQQERHSLALPGRRARREVRRITTRVAGRRPRSGRQLSVNEQRQAALGQDRQRRAQVGLARRREVVDPGVAQEGLDAARAGVEERLERRGTFRDEPAPERAVDVPCPSAASSLRTSASRVVVTGLLLSGMSTSVVTRPPPQRASRCRSPPTRFARAR